MLLKKISVIFLCLILTVSFVAAGSLYNFLERITGMVPSNTPNLGNSDAPGDNAQAVGLEGEPQPPRCGDGICETAEAHTDDQSAVYCPEDCNYAPEEPPVEEPPQDQPPSTDCIDSDGQNYNLKGEVRLNGVSYVDICYSAEKVEEFVCSEGEVKSVVYVCPDGACAESACVLMPTASTPPAYAIATNGVVQVMEISPKNVAYTPPYFTVTSEPRNFANANLRFERVGTANVVTLSKSFEVKDGSLVMIGGKKYKVAFEGRNIVLKAVSGKRVTAQVTQKSSAAIVSRNPGERSNIVSPSAGVRQPLIKRIAGFFR